MANKYCIASGNYNDPAIWSDTDGGSGGASVPTSTDNRHFNRSAIVHGLPTPQVSETYIAADADIEWRNVSVLSVFGVLNVQGTLRFTGTVNDYRVLDGAALVLGDRGFLSSSSAFLIYGSTVQIENRGCINRIGLLTTDGSYRVGFANELLFIALGYPVTLRLNGRLSQSEKLVFNLITNHPITAYFETEAEFGLIRVSYNTSYSETITVNHYSDFRVYGNALLSGLPNLVWNSHSVLPTFFGTADQTISMPSYLTDANWIVDKPAGALYLDSYCGSLQGRLRNLVVGTSSRISLDGISPTLGTSNSDWACYDGLKADATSADDLKQAWTHDDHLRESMDSVDNYGTIHIPSGKTICTKKFFNRQGASVTGNGTLCIRDGGLTNLGNIASTVVLQRFDLDLSVSLHAPATADSGEEYCVQISGSNVASYRIDWGDGSFSERQTAGVLSHAYANSTTDVFRTLTLTATSPEGKTKTTTENIFVRKTKTDSSSIELSENDENRVGLGIPRGSLPSYYRYDLAQGVYCMLDTLQLFCPMNESGRSVENGSALFLGRITHSDGIPVSQSEILSASYTIYRLDDSDPSVRRPVDGHSERPLIVSDVLLPNLLVDANWTFDSLGYNFKHALDDSVASPFPKAGRNYLVDYTLRVSDAPAIRIQYRVRVV